MKTKKVLIIIIFIAGICGLITVPCRANFKMADAGTATAQFLKLGVGGRAIGMSGAYTSVADDPTAVYWNPAGLASIAEESITLMHAVWFESVFYDFAAYAQPVGHFGVMGLGVQYLSTGKIDELDNSGYKVGSFKPNDMAITLSWAEDYDDLLIGVSLKHIVMEIKNSASVLAADVGAMYPFLINDGKIGFTVQNIGGKAQFNEQEERLPLTYRFGVSFHPMHDWLLSLDGVAPVDYAPYGSLGTEYCLGNWHDYSLSLRAGYTTHMIKSELDGIAGISGGMGFSLWDVNIDYAWVPYGDLGQTHRISLGYRF